MHRNSRLCKHDMQLSSAPLLTPVFVFAQKSCLAWSGWRFQLLLQKLGLNSSAIRGIILQESGTLQKWWFRTEDTNIYIYICILPHSYISSQNLGCLKIGHKKMSLARVELLHCELPRKPRLVGVGTADPETRALSNAGHETETPEEPTRGKPTLCYDVLLGPLGLGRKTHQISVFHDQTLGPCRDKDWRKWESMGSDSANSARSEPFPADQQATLLNVQTQYQLNWWFIMVYRGLSWFIMVYHHPISMAILEVMLPCHIA